MAKAAKNKLTDKEQVDAHIAQLGAALKPVVQELRTIILSADERIAEHIKWNNPAFYYTGEMPPSDPKEYKRDIAVFNLFKGRIMLVLPSGARLPDPHQLLEGKYADGRRTIIFKDIDDAQAKSAALKALIANWITTIDN